MKFSVLLPMLIAGASLTLQAAPQSQQLPDTQRIKSHMRFLSDDLLQGRETGSVGHEIASLYIASEFEKYGLQPAGDNGSYFQRVNMRQAMLEQDSPALSLITEQGTQEFDYPSQFLTGADTVRTESAMKGELVFVGYGIIAPELGHDDYQGLDVEGKIVVTLAGKPASFPSEEGAHFASGYQKSHYAAQAGAIGSISVSTPVAEKIRPYQRLLNFLHTPGIRWLDADGQPASVFPQLQGSAYLSQQSAAHLFAGAEKSLEQIYQMLEKDQVPRGFALPGRIEFSKKSRHSAISSPNVAAILQGSDPVLKNEYVVFSAHSDHIGLSKSVKKDKINNGAMDNASGTAVMLETARLFSQLPQRPKRSILFVAVTGEERGLLGADYFARNPTVPAGSMVANVNLDMPILTYPFADVIAFGASHSDMKASVAKAAESIGLSLSPDPWPEQALFTRSDHYAFVKQGIPSVFLVPGLKTSDPDIDGAKVFATFLQTHYHKPSDDFNQPFNWQAADNFTRVNYQIGLTLANQDNRPAWNQGDFFGETFAK